MWRKWSKERPEYVELANTFTKTYSICMSTAFYSHCLYLAHYMFLLLWLSWNAKAMINVNVPKARKIVRKLNWYGRIDLWSTGEANETTQVDLFLWLSVLSLSLSFSLSRPEFSVDSAFWLQSKVLTNHVHACGNVHAVGLGWTKC